MSAKRYCELCDRWVSAKETECKQCGADTTKAATTKPAPRRT